MSDLVAWCKANPTSAAMEIEQHEKAIRSKNEELASLRAELDAARASSGTAEPVAWRVYCTDNGATGYLYTEVEEFDPGPGVTVRRQPEPLYAHPAPAVTASVREALQAARDYINLYMEPCEVVAPAILAAIDAALSTAPTREDEAGKWQPIETAPRDREPVLLKLKDRIPRDRKDLRSFDGLMFVGRYYDGASHWGFAAPVGMCGFPDDWFEGWRALPSTQSGGSQ